jgi:hypothetical protein
MVSSDKIQAIAAAINEKTGNNAGMTLEEMADAIKNIQTVSDKNYCGINFSFNISKHIPATLVLK